uniref:Uncharacterized protein n=1 Tax=Nelumbo nucifera TaxID=4432 RepID=A0A822YQA6_NELNU|nr:TPA_asm: hypothetical protein HUJ06_012066 [Nelumbo nucifera]
MGLCKYIKPTPNKCLNSVIIFGLCYAICSCKIMSAFLESSNFKLQDLVKPELQTLNRWWHFEKSLKPSSVGNKVNLQELPK